MNMYTIDKQYIDLCERISHDGDITVGRDYTTYALFGDMIKVSMLDNRFPLLSLRHISARWGFEECKWYIGGNSDVAILQQNGITMWDKWVAKDNTHLGISYCEMFRKFPSYDGMSIDQLMRTWKLLKEGASTRRAIITLWHPDWRALQEYISTAPPPCPITLQFRRSTYYLSLRVDFRSSDVACGLPYDLVTFGWMLVLMARALCLQPKSLVFTFGDVHIYESHYEQLFNIIDRYKNTDVVCPRYVWNSGFRLTGFDVLCQTKWYQDITIAAYNPKCRVTFDPVQ